MIMAHPTCYTWRQPCVTQSHAADIDICCRRLLPFITWMQSFYGFYCRSFSLTHVNRKSPLFCRRDNSTFSARGQRLRVISYRRRRRDSSARAQRMRSSTILFERRRLTTSGAAPAISGKNRIAAQVGSIPIDSVVVTGVCGITIW